METGSVFKSLGQIHCRWRRRQPHGWGWGCAHAGAASAACRAPAPRGRALQGSLPASRPRRARWLGSTSPQPSGWPHFGLFGGGDPVWCPHTAPSQPPPIAYTFRTELRLYPTTPKRCHSPHLPPSLVV